MSSSGLEEASASAASCFRASGVTPALAARWLVEALENSCPGLTSAALSALPSALGRLSSLASPQGTLLALLDTARPAALLEPARACELRRRADAAGDGERERGRESERENERESERESERERERAALAVAER